MAADFRDAGGDGEVGGPVGGPETALRGGGLPLPGLKHWRLRKGMSQTELARRAELKDGYVARVTGEDKDDLTIPGVAHGFSTLKAAQAQSDLETLHACGRRVIRLRLAGKAALGLQELLLVTRTATRRL